MPRIARKTLIDLCVPYLPEPIIKDEISQKTEVFDKIERTTFHWNSITDSPAFIEVLFKYDTNEKKIVKQKYCIFCTYTNDNGWVFQDVFRSY